MEILELAQKIIPKDIFKFKENGYDLIENVQYLIEQCHPAATKMKVLSLEANSSTATIPYGIENRALHGLMHGGCFILRLEIL
ncbi:hypothetical protein P3G55_05700 [Leptospira sp. 96542]|nr:hypothetical protein [Leptospira sp. 96542]